MANEVDIEAYFREMFAGMPGGEEFAEKAITAAKADPNWAKHASRFGMRESDYSRKMNEAKRAKEEADQIAATGRTYYSDLQRWKAEKDAEYAAGGGPRAVRQPDGNGGGDRREMSDPNPRPASPGAGYVPASSVEDIVKRALADFETRYDKKIEERGDAIYGVLNDVGDCSVDYVERFGKRMDRKALEAFAIEQQLPVGIAYKLWIQPDLDKKKDEDSKKALEEAEQRGFQRAMETRDNPTYTGDATPHPLFRPHATPEGVDPKEAAYQRYREEHDKSENWQNPLALTRR